MLKMLPYIEMAQEMIFFAFFLALTHFCAMCEDDFVLSVKPKSLSQEMLHNMQKNEKANKKKRTKKKREKK